MSGAFEVAAGAFAVVGVADVLVRAGRDLYNFLCDIEDAPNNAMTLRDGIAETVLLANASKRCLLDLEARTRSASVAEVIDTLHSALKALDREVKSLKALTSKCKGSTKRWSNIRYALSEQRINKALSRLERSKTLLTSTLTLACRELTGSDNQEIRNLVQQAASTTVDLTQAVNARFDANEQSIATHLDALGQQNLTAQISHQHALVAKLNAHHQELATAHSLHQSSLRATQNAQMSAAISQNRLQRVSMQTNRRTALISRDMKVNSRASNKQHQQTRDLIITTFRDLQIVQAQPAPRAANGGRQIAYSGEQRDIIGPALYSLKKELAFLFDQLFTNYCQEVSPSHIAWLQSELQNLVASAAQEEASSHSMSTATSFDQWIYCGEPNESARRSKERGAPVSTSALAQRGPLPLQKRRKRLDRLLVFKTARGMLQVRLPRRGTTSSTADTCDEVSLSFVSTIDGPFAALSTHFIRAENHLMAPTICGQLNIFVHDDENKYTDEFYERLFGNGTMQEVDRALRDGSISPYRITKSFELNSFYFYAACFGRMDIFRYLNSQGLGHSTLRQDVSVYLGLIVAVSEANDYEGIYARLGDCVDLSVSPADLAMVGLSLCDRFDGSELDYWSFISACLHRLHMSNPLDLYERRSDTETIDVHLDRIPDVVWFLLESGAEPNMMVGGRSLTQLFLRSALFEECISATQGHNIRKQVLSALIESGANTLHCGNNGTTVADVAWMFGHWDAWCEALQENGLDVQEVDQGREQGWRQKFAKS